MTARRLVRLYPRAWRRRYEDEFVETVGPQPLRTHQIIDIIGGAVDAWTSRSVRVGVRGTAAAAHGGRTMIDQLKLRCAATQPRYTTRDGLKSAGVLLATSLVLTAIGIFLDFRNLSTAADIVKSLAFPVALTVSLPFAVLKGQPRKVVLLSLIVPNIILALATWLAMKI